MPKVVRLNSPADAARIEAALHEPIDKPWKQQRLQAMRMVAQGQWTLQQIAVAVGAGRSSVAVWLKTLREQGCEALVTWRPGQGAPAQVSAQAVEGITQGLAAGRWRRARDVQCWLKEAHAIDLSLPGVYYYLGKAGGVLKVPRKTHAKKDAALGAAFKEELAGHLAPLPLEAGRPPCAYGWPMNTVSV